MGVCLESYLNDPQAAGDSWYSGPANPPAVTGANGIATVGASSPAGRHVARFPHGSAAAQVNKVSAILTKIWNAPIFIGIVLILLIWAVIEGWR